jgi:hypothetical protein
MMRLSRSSFGLRRALLLAAAALNFACSGSAKSQNDACTPEDADGIISEPATLLLTVSDTKFAPIVLTTQNTSEITLTLRNDGTRPHGFVIDCRPTPNDDGCPTQSCFPDESRIQPVAPGEQATVVFETPLVEGLYDFHSDVPEDADLGGGQFLVQ